MTTPLTFRLEPHQLRRMRNLAIGGLLVLSVAIVLVITSGSRWELLLICASVAAIGFGLSYAGQYVAKSIMDRSGVQCRVFFGITKNCDWSDVADVTVAERGHSAVTRFVVLRQKSGAQFALPAPISGGSFPDPKFDDKLAAIRQMWRAAG